jgi:hypothetical protein
MAKALAICLALGQGDPSRELNLPISTVERVADHRVVFRSWREPAAGGVFFTGRARVRRTLMVVRDWRIYRRERLTFPPATGRPAPQAAFTPNLQGINIFRFLGGSLRAG